MPASSRVHGYPRPQLQRSSWFSLNGPWQFYLDADGRLESAASVPWHQTIQVPFSPETAASGIDDRGLYKALWYRRTIEVPALGPKEHLLLHFGAVDYRATVWVGDYLA